MELKSKYIITRDDETHAYTVHTGKDIVTLPGVTGVRGSCFIHKKWYTV